MVFHRIVLILLFSCILHIKECCDCSSVERLKKIWVTQCLIINRNENNKTLWLSNKTTKVEYSLIKTFGIHTENKKQFCALSARWVFFLQSFPRKKKYYYFWLVLILKRHKKHAEKNACYVLTAADDTTELKKHWY